MAFVHPTKRSTRRAVVKRKARKERRFDLMDWWFEQMPWALFADVRRAYRLGLRHARRERRTP